VSAHAFALSVHVAAGSVGLVLGPILMLIPKRRGPHTRLGEVYHWTFLVLFISAVWLAILNPDVWWLAPIGAFSYALALMGYLAAKRRRPGWLVPHIAGQGGSYIAMVSALLTVNWESLTGSAGTSSFLPFILPTVVGAPIITWVIAQVSAGVRPKAWLAGRAS
jgi:uncharacterized membrane protein YeaQ/YmgE (transglycosylase-associated protein family)